MKIASIYTKEVALLESMMSGTDRETRQYLRNMHENFVVPYVDYLNGIKRRLNEAELTPDQINQLFGTAAQQTQAAGGNETMLGKMMPDSIKKKFVDSLPAPDAGEVPGFEQKAQAAAQQVQDPATKQSLMQLIKTGLQNPVTQKLIISGVQGIAGVAAGALTGGLGGKLGATAAGAITGGLVGLVAAKLQGQDWKSAAKAGLKGAAVGGAGGLVGSLASGAASTAMDAMSNRGGDTGGELPGAQLSVGQELPDGEVISGLDSSNPNAGVTIQRPDGSTYSVSRDTAHSMTGQTGISPQATGPVSQGASSDPMAGVTDTDQGAEPAPTGVTNQGRLKMNQWRQETGSPNAVPTTPETPSDGSYQQAAPLGRDGQPMQQVPMDEPAGGGLDNIKPGLAAPLGADGKPMQEVPMDEPAGGGLDNIKPGLAAPLGPDGKPMQEVPMDEPAGGGLDNIKPGLAAPLGADGKPMQEVPMDEPADTATAAADTGAQGGGEISADGKPYPEGLTAAQKQIYDNPIQVGSDNKGTVSFTDGTKLDAVFVPPGGMQPRFPVGAQKMDFPFDGKMVTGYVVGDKVWFPNFQGAAKAESKISKKRAIREYVNKELTVYMWALNEQAGRRRGGVQLTEAGIGDMVKGIGSWLKTKGQNLTQNVTADKLMQAWNKAGKPTDSETVSDIMQKAGVAPEVVNSVFQSMGIPAGATAGDERKEPTLEPEQPAQPAAATPAQPAAKSAEPAAATPAEPAAAEPAAKSADQVAPAPAAGGSVFADPNKLKASFESYLEAGGRVPPQFRGVLKDILLTALRTVESRQRKINKIVKEAKKIQGQIIAIKKQRQKL